MTETTHSKSSSGINWVVWFLAFVLTVRIGLAMLMRLLWEIGLFYPVVAITFILVLLLFGYVTVVKVVPKLVACISASFTQQNTTYSTPRYRGDTTSTAPKSPADRLPDTDARAAHEFSNGREIVPQSLAERDPIEYELEKERRRDQ